MIPLLGPCLCKVYQSIEMSLLQSLGKALDLFIEFKFCESDFYFLNGSKNCMVATYNFGSVYIIYSMQGAQWLSGRVLDSRPKGSWFQPHRRHCVVVLEQDTFILA